MVVDKVMHTLRARAGVVTTLFVGDWITRTIHNGEDRRRILEAIAVPLTTDKECRCLAFGPELDVTIIFADVLLAERSGFALAIAIVTLDDTVACVVEDVYPSFIICFGLAWHHMVSVSDDSDGAGVLVVVWFADFLVIGIQGQASEDKAAKGEKGKKMHIGIRFEMTNGFAKDGSDSIVSS